MTWQGRIRLYETLAYITRFLKAANASLLGNEKGIIFQQEQLSV